MKGKKTIVVGLAILLTLGISTVASKDDKLSVVYTFESTLGGCGEFLIRDTQIMAIPGEPLTPYKVARILLPEGTEAKNVKVDTGTPVIQEGFDIPWGQPPCTFSDIPVKVGRNEKIYGSDNLYPKKVFQVIGVDYCKGFAILYVHLFPVQYMPKSGTVIFYPKMTVEVQLGKGIKNELYRGLAADKEDVAGMVDNPEVVGTYEDGPVPLATEEYIIITNDTMQSTFQTLATHKASYVNGATVYTVAWITANYTGTDNAMKIRNFIIDKYTNNGTKYVLLGGDVSAVPYRGFYVSTGGYTDTDMLADMYFGHLDGTHNADGDSYYGETNDSVDFTAEVAVGRAPCETVAEAQNFVNKVIAYEQAAKPKRALLHESRVQAGNNPDARCLAYSCDDYLPADYVKDYVFEEDSGGVPKSRWISQWGQNPLAVAHIGHGNTNVYYINYEKDVGTVSWYNTDVASLTNTFWPWTTSVACITGQIEANDCLSEAYVMDANNGAIAAIYNDNYGWFNTSDACMYSGEFCINEFRACWSDGKEKFGEMLNKTRSYLASSAQSDTTYRWCYYERNLVGDPESPCLTVRGGDSVTITYPSDGQTVSAPITVTTSTQGCIDTVEFYIDGVLKYTDTTAPFSYSWDTTAYSDGNHTIEVKGYCSGVYKDNDIVTVTVCTDCWYYVIITNPTEGQTVSGTVTCAATTNCTSVKWYIDGTYKAEDTTSPFQYSWDTTAYADGSHTVKAEGYLSGVLKAQDTISVTVHNCYARIANPPPSGATVSCTVTINVETACIDTVEFYIDDVLTYTDTSSPFQYVWDTCSSSDGFYTITVKGYESGVLKDSDTVTYEVYHYYVRIIDPQQGDIVSGTVPITIDANCVDTVELYIDDELKLTETIDSPHEGGTVQYGWNTCPYTNGTHTIKVKGYESGQFKGFAEITVQTDNEYIKITSPVQGQTVSGLFTITTGAPCIGVVTVVEFYIDGIWKKADSSYPFEYDWDTCPYTNGEHTITVKAYGPGLLFGHVGTLEVLIDTDEITVQVNNGCLEITDPQQNAEVFGIVPIKTETTCVDKVEFYIGSVLKYTDFEAPFEYNWDTTGYFEDWWHVIRALGYYQGQLRCTDEVTVTVNNYNIEILNPENGSEVYGLVPITIDPEKTRGIDIVQFYIDGFCLYTDCEAPFEYNWDTTGYEDDVQYTITVKGFTNEQIPNCPGLLSNSGQPESYSISPKASDQVIVRLNNFSVEITNPSQGQTVSGTVTITVDARGVDTVKFYIDSDNNALCTDTQSPFQCNWDTTQYSNGEHTIIVKGYKEGNLKAQDSITCTVDWSAFIFLGMFSGFVGIVMEKS